MKRPERSRLFPTAHAGPTLLLLMILLLITGCRGANDSATLPEQPGVSGESQNQPPASGERAGIPQPAGDQESLVLWAPPFFSISAGDRADAVLAAALAEFAPTTNGAPVILLPKADRGASGLPSYLSAASRVATAILPDVVLLHSFDLARAANAGIITAISEEEAAQFPGIPAHILATARLQGTLYGLPYVAALEHLAYQKERLPTPPSTWDAFLAQDKRLLFAGGSADEYSIPFAWTLYLLRGGRLDEAGNWVDLEILQGVFTDLQAGRGAGLLPDSAITLSSPQPVWTFFTNGDAEMAVVPATLFRNQQNESSSIGYAPIPAGGNEARAVVTSWSFAIVTEEPERRQKVLRLLEQLFALPVQGEWSWSARRVPTQPDAFAYWDANDPYTQFLQESLTSGIAAPNLRALDNLTRLMQQTQRSLLSGEISVEEAVANLSRQP